MSKALTGKWILNDKIYPLNAGDMSMIHYVWFKSGFTSNGQRFKAIRFAENVLKYETESGLVEAGAGYQEDDYATPYEQYRVIDFGAGSEANDDSDGTFVAWFLSNVTRYGTVADKLVQIAKNEKAVYQSGYDKALEKGGYNQGVKDGKDEERDAFWDAYMPEKLPNSQYLFYSPRWNDKNFYPNKDIKPNGAATFAFSSHQITNFKQRLIDCKVTLDTSKVTGGDYMFCFCGVLTNLPTISFVGLTSQIKNTFQDDRSLEEIEKIILKDDGSTTFNLWFSGCNSLTDIAFEGVIGNDINFQWSPLLTEASIRSIVNHLSDNSGGSSAKVLTLSKTAVDEAFKGGKSTADPSTTTDIGSGTTDWWDLDYSASMKNWTITLV